MKSRILVPALTALALASALSLNPRVAAQSPGAVDPALLGAYQWRSIGPLRGGRSIAVSGVKGRPKEAYFGAVGGGLWKTTDGGDNWAPVTDGKIRSASVGAIAVSESHPDIVYIGMGESCIRGNIMPGDGMYKSTDAGKTWTHIAFGDNTVDAISKIRVHPTNPDIVYAAVFGKYGRPSAERGLFKSTDGGKTWRKTLYRDDKTGAVDLVIDPNNPNVLYTALWEAYRVEYQMSSGGPGSGLFKSTDAGETWQEITRAKGMPSGVVGRIGVAVAKADSNRVYALVENARGGLYVSDDAGASWTLVNENRNIRQRAFYYTHVTADTKDKDTVYLLNVSAYRSTDGGKSLTSIGGGTHGDHHDLWVDADDPNHLVIGNDGGGAVAVTAGAPVWTPQDFPTAQYYHVITTKHVPFHVCGAQQDGSTVCLSSAQAGGRGGGTPEMYGAGGAEPGYIAPDPLNVDIIYAGGNNGSFLTRLDRRTNNLREVNPYPRLFSGEPASELVERWQWTYPIIFSQADPRVLFTSSQYVYRTTNGGDSWDRISPDLSLHDPETLGPTGGPITHDMNSPEVYATVFAIGPGKKNVDVIWAGTDDGLVHVTQNGGKSWTNITPKDMPRLGRVSQIDASSFGDGTAYVAVKKPLLADFAPYIYRTHDFGKTWTRIVSGIRADDYVHTVREDPTRKGMLYAGTQHGVYVSYNDGDTWQSLSLNLPDVPVSDLWVEADALAISTHGRSFYVLDNIAALRQAGTESTGAFHLYKPADAIRTVSPASISYLLRKPAQSLTIEIVDGKGQVVQTIRGGQGGPGGQGGRGGGGGGGGRGGGGGATASMSAGFNRTNWNLNYPGAVTFPGMILWGATTNGPLALPGTYQVRMTVDGATQTQPLVVRKHPLRNTPDADITEQFNLALQIRDKVSEANNAVILIRRIKDEVAARMKMPAAANDARLKTAADRLTAALSAVEQDIYQVKNQSGQDPLNFPIKTNNRLASLLGMTLRGEGKPTANIYPIFEDLKKELKAETDRLEQALAKELAAFNAEARRAGVEPISR